MTASGEIASRDTGALDRLFRTHYLRIARVIGRVIHDQARAEELAVDVFLKWWRHPPAHGDRAEGWLYRTAVRQALDELRRRRRRERMERVVQYALRTPATPEQVYASADEQHRVRAVLVALSRRHAELLLLRHEGLGYQDIAIALDLNSTYVGSLLSRAQDAFRKEYVKRHGTT